MVKLVIDKFYHLYYNEPVRRYEIMKSTGMRRAVDKMGRVVIPKEIREQLKIVDDVDSFEIFMEKDAVILKKYHPACVFCDSVADVEYEGYLICNECIEKLNNLKENF